MNLLKARNGPRVVGLVLVGLSACALLNGQQDAGVLRVFAEDQSGSVAQGATVKVTNVDTNASISQLTNSQGYATFSPIARGTYVVQVSLHGFAVVRLSGVSIDVNQNRLETVRLQLAAVAEQVEVTAAAAVIQTEEASLGQVVSGRVISELPLAARRYTDLTLLMPGSADAQVTTETRGPGWLVVNGNSQTMNNFLLDGFDNNQNTHNMQSRSAQVMLPSPDTLSEFKVQTDNYTAEFGRAMGAVINASIKSGTNQFHGSAWWYNRDAALASNSWQANWQNAGKSNLKWNQEGGTLGGPVKQGYAIPVWRLRKLPEPDVGPGVRHGTHPGRAQWRLQFTDHRYYRSRGGRGGLPGKQDSRQPLRSTRQKSVRYCLSRAQLRVGAGGVRRASQQQLLFGAGEYGLREQVRCARGLLSDTAEPLLRAIQLLAGSRIS